jgi:hypothetical protein
VLVHGLALRVVKLARIRGGQARVEHLLDGGVHLRPGLLALPPVQYQLLALERVEQVARRVFTADSASIALAWRSAKPYTSSGVLPLWMA